MTKRNFSLLRPSAFFISGCSLLFFAAPVFAQIGRPPVPAAQAQSFDDNATASFNNEVSAQGGAPDMPPSDSDNSSSSLSSSLSRNDNAPLPTAEPSYPPASTAAPGPGTYSPPSENLSPPQKPFVSSADPQSGGNPPL